MGVLQRSRILTGFPVRIWLLRSRILTVLYVRIRLLRSRILTGQPRKNSAGVSEPQKDATYLYRKVK